jgi:hypothetical protein
VIIFKWGLIAAIIASFISILMGIIFEVRVFYIFIRALIFSVLFFGLGIGLRFLVNAYFPEFLYKDDENAAGELDDQGGSQVIVAQEETGEYAVPELYKTAGDPEELGNIDDLLSGAFKSRSGSKGIDRNKEAGYNGVDSGQEVSSFFPEELTFEQSSFNGRSAINNTQMENQPVDRPQFSPSFGEASFGENSGLNGLPDLDMMARAFTPGLGGSIPAFESTVPISPVAEPVSTPAESSFMPAMEEFEPEKQFRGGNKPQPIKGDFNPKELAEGLRSVLAKDK